MIKPPPLPTKLNKKPEDPGTTEKQETRKGPPPLPSKVKKDPEGGKIAEPEEDEKPKLPDNKVEAKLPDFMKPAAEAINKDVDEKKSSEEKAGKSTRRLPFLPDPEKSTGKSLPKNMVTEEVKATPPEVKQAETIIGNPIGTPPPLPGASPFQQGNTPAKPASNPFSVSKGLFEIRLPENASSEFMEVYEKKQPVEELVQKDRRVVYYQIGGKMGTPVYSATTINHIAKTGKHPDEVEREDDEFLFTGTAVHEAMETQGESLKKLFYFDSDSEPEMPDEYKKLSKDHRLIAESMIMEDKSDLEAYMLVKDTVAVKKVDPKWISEDYVFECDKEIAELKSRLQDLTEERDHNQDVDLKTIDAEINKVETAIEKVKDSDDKKAVTTVAKAAKKEYDKIKDSFPKIKQYLETMDRFEKKKEDVRARAAKVEGAVVINDLHYIPDTAGQRIYQNIAKTFGALQNAKDAYNVYHPDEVSTNKFDLYNEYVMLDKYKLPTGKEVPIKGMVDRLIFDHTAKVVWCIDLKTHGRNDFLKENYVMYSYDRSMSVYKYLVEREAKRLGYGDYQIVMSILPISTKSLEVGYDGVSLLNISEADLQRGREGGYVKPDYWSYMDENDMVRRTLTEKGLEDYMNKGAITGKRRGWWTRGWEKVILDYEDSKTPKVNTN